MKAIALIRCDEGESVWPVGDLDRVWIDGDGQCGQCVEPKPSRDDYAKSRGDARDTGGAAGVPRRGKPPNLDARSMNRGGTAGRARAGTRDPARSRGTDAKKNACCRHGADADTLHIFRAPMTQPHVRKLQDGCRAAQIRRSGGIATAAFIAALTFACSRADSQRVAGDRPDALATAQNAGGLTIATADHYRVGAPIGEGRVSGSISFDGQTPADSIVHPTTDADVCGQTLVDPTVDHRGPLLANAVVWIDGITAGKPLPVARRYDITNEGCRLVPRIQAAVAGGTLDVRNADQATHLTRFVSASTRTVLAAVPETEAGAVVPSRAVLASPGVVAVSCDMHPWAKAWVLVFNQPYFTTTNANGAFVIDSVPPGRYRVSVWHERFGTQSDSVTVIAGQDAVVNITFKNHTLGG